MIDNLKTWPENIQTGCEDSIPAYQHHFDIECPWTFAEVFGHDIKYIRADIAKEREEKLIKATFDVCNYRIACADLYKYAGVEELK